MKTFANNPVSNIYVMIYLAMVEHRLRYEIKHLREATKETIEFFISSFSSMQCTSNPTLVELNPFAIESCNQSRERVRESKKRNRFTEKFPRSLGRETDGEERKAEDGIFM